MFNLDHLVLNYCYNRCQDLGSTFYLGAKEGAIIYLALITFIGFKAIQIRSAKK